MESSLNYKNVLDPRFIDGYPLDYNFKRKYPYRGSLVPEQFFHKPSKTCKPLTQQDAHILCWKKHYM